MKKRTKRKFRHRSGRFLSILLALSIFIINITTMTVKAESTNISVSGSRSMIVSMTTQAPNTGETDIVWTTSTLTGYTDKTYKAVFQFTWSATIDISGTTGVYWGVVANITPYIKVGDTYNYLNTRQASCTTSGTSSTSTYTTAEYTQQVTIYIDDMAQQNMTVGYIINYYTYGVPSSTTTYGTNIAYITMSGAYEQVSYSNMEGGANYWWSNISNKLTSIENTVASAIATAQSAVTDAISTAQSAVTGAISTAQDAVTSAISTAQSAVTSAISTAQNAITTALNNQTDNITNGYSNEEADEANEEMGSIADSLTSAEDSLMETVDIDSVDLGTETGNILKATDFVNAMTGIGYYFTRIYEESGALNNAFSITMVLMVAGTILKRNWGSL